MKTQRATTLQGQEVLDYLDNLENLLKNNSHEEGSTKKLLQEQMLEIIQAERNIAQYYTENHATPQLAIAPNDLPSIETLTADMDMAIQLGDRPEYSALAQKLQRGIRNREQDETAVRYNETEAEEWTEKRKEYEKKGIRTRTGIKISELENEIFKIELEEETYLNGTDKGCTNHPILIRKGTIHYRQFWNKLREGTTERYFVGEPKLDEEFFRGEDLEGTALAKREDPKSPVHTGKKMRRIRKLEEEIKKHEELIKKFSSREVSRRNQKTLKKIHALKAVLELEKNHPGTFDWRNGLWYYTIVEGDAYEYCNIYEKKFLDQRIAALCFFYTGFIGSEITIGRIAINDIESPYLSTLRKAFPSVSFEKM